MNLQSHLNLLPFQKLRILALVTHSWGILTTGLLAARVLDGAHASGKAMSSKRLEGGGLTTRCLSCDIPYVWQGHDGSLSSAFADDNGNARSACHSFGDLQVAAILDYRLGMNLRGNCFPSHCTQIVRSKNPFL